MEVAVNTAEFIKSSTRPDQYPQADFPEYAFIGRSNVGKSSLINMLTGRKALAKTSSTPGKTQLVNHFLIDRESNAWLLADLPGYGYAKVSKKERRTFDQMIRTYLKQRENLMCSLVLLDSRHTPQKNDLEFMEWLGANRLPFVMVFTKADKLSSSERLTNLKAYQREMLKTWEYLPQIFHTSAEKGQGREELLTFIRETNEHW